MSWIKSLTLIFLASFTMLASSCSSDDDLNKEAPAEEYVTKAFGVEVNARTNVATPAGEYHTNVERVFTAGDMHRGQSLVVWAIREGREAAQEIDVSLMGYTNMNVQ